MSDKKCYASAIVVVILVILIFDAIWLGVINKKSWNEQVRDIQGTDLKARPLGAVTAYALLVTAVIVLGVSRVNKENLVRDSLVIGAVIGLCIYGVFDGTVYALFKNYKLSTAIVDILWGTFLMAVATLAGAWAANHWKWFVK
jgi:uncharacterized membrane protein